MWSQILLACLVGFAFSASNNPAWKDNTEYTYNVRGRTVVSLNEVSNQYTGILLKAKLTLQPQIDGSIIGKISEPQYGQIHTALADGWNSNVPESQISYKQLPLSGKTFKVALEQGVIKNLIVSRDIPNWEANIIKSILSQFQLDTKAENLIQSPVNTLPEGSNNAVFKTMEDSVSGQTETLYDIHPLPEYILQDKPWLAPQPQLIGDGEMIEIVKNKNYTNSKQRPAYWHGLSGMEDWEPTTNQMGDFFSRSSNSRVVVSGSLRRYTVQSSYTVNKIVMSPTLTDDKKGSVVSLLNVTLSGVVPTSDKLNDVTNAVSLGSLVYRFEDPYTTGHVRDQHQGQDDSQDYRDNSEEYRYVPHPRLFRRSLDMADSYDYEQQQRGWRSQNNLWRQQQQQNEPSMERAPASPLLPNSVGYKGQFIKSDPNFNIVEKLQKVAQEIGQYSKGPESILEKHVLSRFTILSHLIRIADSQELQQVAQRLYSQEPKGPNRDTWSAYRDALAQAATGPASLTIFDLIQSSKIEGYEAGLVVSTMARNVRQPTQQYIRKFFEMIKSQKVQSQPHLRETAILSLAQLLHKVYVADRESHNEYPVHAFGKFNTKQGKQYMRETIVPWLGQQLKQAVAEANSPKILAYIVALGRIGDRSILKEYEPYLEGKKQSSQFQRLLMVVSMDRLSKSRPDVALSVLYKIYQNIGEIQEIRAAAVFQLMRTSPPTDMLQRMAQYTHVDEHDDVNAAVKSSIETAAELKGDRFAGLRNSAKAAKPYLTKKTFGARQSQNSIRGWALSQLKVGYKQVIQSITGEGAFFPKSIKYSLHGFFGGLQRHLMNVQAMVSSIDELTTQLWKQTSSYKRYYEESRFASEHKFSSQHIAGLLNLKDQEKEQLEGLLTVEMSQIQNIISFDNHTIENLPKNIKELQDALEQGRSIHQMKFMDLGEFVMAFPTEMGLPFVYNYQKPVVVKLSGEFKAQAEPKVVQDGKLRQPDTVSIKAEIKATAHGKVQGHLSFIAPFEHQIYVAGYDKQVLVHAPIRANIKVNIQKMQVEAEFEAIQTDEPTNKQRIFQYKTWPFTSRADLLSAEPLATRPTTYFISQKLQQGFDKVFGKEQTGYGIRVQYLHEQQRNDYMWLQKLIEKQDILALSKIYETGTIENTQFNVHLLPNESSTKKIVVKLGYQQEYKKEGGDESNASTSENLQQIGQTNANSEGRQQEFMKKVSAGIKSVNVKAMDVEVEFQGQQSIKYQVTGAVGKSNVDPKSRVLVLYKQHGNQYPYEIVLGAKSQIPNTNGLGVSDSLRTEPQANSEVKVVFGQSLQQSPSTIEATFQLRRSKDRLQYLLEEPEYQHCRRQMQEGNNQQPACANMTIRANKLDQIQVQVHHQNLKPQFSRTVQAMFDALSYSSSLYPFVEIKNNQGGSSEQIQVNARFAPNLQAVNVSVQAGEQETHFKNILVNELTQTIFVSHPVFHLPARVYGKALGFQNYRPACVVDQTEATTFSNKSYPVTSLTPQWTVMMQYVQEKARQHQEPHASGKELLKHQLENYLVLIRTNKENPRQKDVKITLSEPRSNGEVVEINLKPAQSGDYSGDSSRARVYQGEQQVQISKRQSYDIHKDLVQIYELPNGEVKVEVRDKFYVIYDGQRAKLTIRNGQFRDQIRGLCGQFNDQKSTDFLTPQNRIVGNVREFIQTWNVEAPQPLQKHAAANLKTVRYVNVISSQDVGQQYGNGGDSYDVCTQYQTRYVQQNGETCFTLRPMPVCKCQQNGTIKKQVAVHCVDKSNVAAMWKQQIDNGASPDFGSKQETKRIEMHLPAECSGSRV